jgi:hypothetical protein
MLVSMPEIRPFDELFGTFDESTIMGGFVVPDASSGEGILRSSQQCKEWADHLKCDVIEATDKQLFVDLDTETQFKLFEFQIKLLKKHFYFLSYRVEPSKQGLPHRHVTVELADPYPLMTRIALQACLGSDPARELLSVRRAMDQEDNVVIFFEKKKESI